MSHQCTNCGRAFADGSKQMLAGCPECGGNKFQFLPNASVGDERAEAPRRETGLRQGAGTERQDASTDSRHDTGSESQPGPDTDIIEAPLEPVEETPSDPREETADVEDSAQASARRSIVSNDELPAVERVENESASEERVAPTEEPEPEPERPDLAQLRKELNEQFESIKILRPGAYELNLMELYDREEYIIALEEDGRYVIDVPDTWRESE